VKISAQEEYGIRCLLQLGSNGAKKSLTIPEISRAEGLSGHYVAKLMRVLRRGGLVLSERGQAGGYRIARPLNEISVAEAMAVLGGRLYDPTFCEQHVGSENVCAHTVDCSIRSLWRSLQQVVDQVLGKTTLEDLVPKPAGPLPPQGPSRMKSTRMN
jgi:Rrf2 family iron-sulfur cluster assembly transcriptional regulator